MASLKKLVFSSLGASRFLFSTCPRISPRSLSSLASAAETFPVPEESVRKFEEDGAALIRGAIPMNWVQALRSAAEENMRNPGPLCDEHTKPGEPGRFHDDQFLWQRHGDVRRFIFESATADIAAQMMRSKTARLFYDHLLVKEPGTKTKTPWHNDYSYWQISGRHIVSIWLALDHVPKASCVNYARGSHKWEILHRITRFDGDEGRYKDMPSLPPPLDIADMKDVELLAWDMEPGDCLIHHGYTFHGAAGATAQMRRAGYSTRWLGDDITFDPRPGTMHYWWAEVAGLDPKLKPGDPMVSDLFPQVQVASHNT